MKKQVKKNLIVALSFAFIASLGVAGLAKTDVSATGAVEEVAVAGNFQMDDGAAIRIKSNSPSGIRWSVTVSESYYNYVTSLGEVQWGMVVDNKAITEKGGETQVDIPLKNQSLPNFNADDGVEETWTYYASITYDELDVTDTATLTEVYETVLYARAYNVVNDVVTLAVDADTGRAIKGVAMHCLVENTSDVTTDNRASFVDYAGGDYAVVETKDFNNESAYATYAKTGVVTAEVADGDYDAYFGAKYLGKVTATDGKATVNPTGLATSQLTLGKLSNISLVNGNEVAKVPFIAATHIIGDQASGVSDGTEWSDEMKYSGTSPEPTKDWYVVVVKDMDLGGVNRCKGRGEARFHGRFNGLGHTISNYKVGGDQRALFGAFGSTSDHGVFIENVAFTDVIVSGTNGYPIAEYVYGTMHRLQNVYVQATYTTQGACQGVWRNTGSATVNNCIADLTYTTAPEKAYAFSDSSATASYFYDCFAATNAKATVFSSSTDDNKATPTTNVSNSINALTPAIKASMAAEENNNWAEYWTCDDYSIYYGDNVVAQNKTTLETAYLDEDTKISLSALTGGSVEKVLLNGNQINVDGDDWTCVVADYTVAEENTITVYGNGKIVEQPFVVCTYVINTYKEFDDLMQDTINAVGHDSTGWYIVLGTDIDANDGTKTNELYIQSNNQRKFEGTFNGLGHTVSNLKVVGQGGIFGQIIDATIENVAFVNLTKGGDWYILTNYCYNTNYIRNVYISGTTTTGEAIITRGNGQLHLQNVIANIENAGAKKNVTFWEEGSNTYIDTDTNYAIGDFTSAQYGGKTTGATLCADVEAFKSSYLATITEENGWNMDVWSVKDGELYFGETKVQ